MKSLVIIDDNPMNAWKSIVENYNDGLPCFVETDLTNIDLESNFFKRYYKEFKWHFNDSYRSLMIKMTRNLTPYEFSYYDRIHDYFGQDQEHTILANQNNVISLWDVTKDPNNNPKPCLLTLKVIRDKDYLHLSITFRNRDIIRRMYPNFVALSRFHNNLCKQLSLKQGKLFDYSNQIIVRKQDLDKVKSWEEFRSDSPTLGM